MGAAVTHFEIYAEDAAKLADFYRQIFDWKIEKAPGVDYFRIETGAPALQSIGGGLLYRPVQGPRSWVHYVRVQSVDNTIERVQSLGGRVVRGKDAVPKTAWCAILEDPQGNIFGVYELDPTAMPTPEPD